MIEFARYENEEHTSIIAGPIEGQTWSRITEASRFWPIVMEWAEDNEIADYVPPVVDTDGIAVVAAQSFLQQMTAAKFIKDEAISEEDKKSLVPIFLPWKVDEVVGVGMMRRHNGTLYECIQGHTTQADWEPQNTPALWNSLWEGAPGEVEPWTQPQGAHDAYQIGAKVTHNGKTWTNTVANNVWEPGVHGWVEDA